MLIKLDMPINKKYLVPVFNRFDSNRSGVIEFAEFSNYIVND